MKMVVAALSYPLDLRHHSGRERRYAEWHQAREEHGRKRDPRIQSVDLTFDHRGLGSDSPWRRQAR